MKSATDIDGLARGYARLIAAAWDEVQEAARLSQTGSFVEDWLQANWEMFVEAALPPNEVFLEVYGEGADCNDHSSRIYRPEVRPTHAVVCVSRSGQPDVLDLLSNEPFRIRPRGLMLEELVTMEGGWYVAQPPFDCVLVNDGDIQRVVRVDAVDFTLSETTTGARA